ncbi:Cytochrome c oxidase copper chaperone 1 [Picochlorum sp. SENEW3]|nr:Cytochrome c oxidase copper chaperone 1 [Picochlorum sp. SENEW3]
MNTSGATDLTQEKKPTKKICCACPETKKVRDECIALHGPDSEECQKLIEAHKACLRAEGFKIE